MNYHLFQLINDMAGRAAGLDVAMEFAATWLVYGAFAVAAGVCAHAFYRRRFGPLIRVGVTLGLSFLAAVLVSLFSTEVRPFQTHLVHQLIAQENGIAMPSDHATAAFAIAFSVGTFVNRTWGAVLGAVAVFIAVARIWVGLHYPSDVGAAFLIAAVSVAVVAIAGKLASMRVPAVLERDRFLRGEW